MPKLLYAPMLLAAVILVPAGSNMGQVAVVPDYLTARAQGKQSTASLRHFGIGREARPEEITGWDIDVRPDGAGLPPGKGSVRDGEALFTQYCASCHGEFGEGVGRWPALAGGAGLLTGDRPVKTIGLYWPYASTIIDYVRRAQPFGNPQSLSNDELYAVTAFLLFLNDIIDQDFELSKETFRNIRMPNAQGFHDDDRETAEQAFWDPKPCMTNCKADVKITGRAQALDATPANDDRQRGVDQP